MEYILLFPLAVRGISCSGSHSEVLHCLNKTTELATGPPRLIFLWYPEGCLKRKGPILAGALDVPFVRLQKGP